MKTTKRVLSVLIVLVLCLSICAPAYASNSKYSSRTESRTKAAYSSTQSFLDAMDADSIIYTYHGLDRDNDDWVEVKYTGDYCDTIDIDIYFDADGTSASFRFWNLIDFKASDYYDVLLSKLD